VDKMGFLDFLTRFIKKNTNINNNVFQPAAQKVAENDDGEKRTRRKSKGELIHCTAWVSKVKEYNPGNINRQDVLAKCSIGDAITLDAYEVGKGYYEIEVYTDHGCIGVMYNEELKKIAKYLMNDGEIYNAKITVLKHPKTKRGKIECAIEFEREKMR
jgi:hypothetical protein